MNEPWTASIVGKNTDQRNHAPHDIASIRDALNRQVFRIDLGHGRDQATNEEIVRRLIACVNACAGIPTEALEAGVVLEIRDLLTSAYSNVSHGGPTRGELAAVLRKAGVIS